MVIDSTLMGDSVHIPGLMRPLPLNGRNHIDIYFHDLIHDGQYVYSVFMTQIKFPRGYILEKRDIETGEVLWQYTYDHRNADTLELPIKLFIRNGELHLFCVRAIQPYSAEYRLLNIFFTGIPMVWSMTKFDPETGQLIRRIYSTDKSAQVISSGLDYYHIFEGPNDTYYLLERSRDSIEVKYRRCVFAPDMRLQSCDEIDVPALTITDTADSMSIHEYHQFIPTSTGYVSLDTRYVNLIDTLNRDTLYLMNFWIWDSTLTPIQQIDLFEGLPTKPANVRPNLVYADTGQFILRNIKVNLDYSKNIFGVETIERLDYYNNPLSSITMPLYLDDVFVYSSYSAPYTFLFFLPWNNCIFLYQYVNGDINTYQILPICGDTSISIKDRHVSGGFTFTLSNPEHGLIIYTRAIHFTDDRDIITANEIFINVKYPNGSTTRIPLGFFIARYPGRIFDKSVKVHAVRDKERSIYLYPQPTTGDVVHIGGLREITGIQVRCFDVIGRQYPVTLRDHAVDVSACPPGTYFFHLTKSGTHIGTVRFVRL